MKDNIEYLFTVEALWVESSDPLKKAEIGKKTYEVIGGIINPEIKANVLRTFIRPGKKVVIGTNLTKQDANIIRRALNALGFKCDVLHIKAHNSRNIYEELNQLTEISQHNQTDDVKYEKVPDDASVIVIGSLITVPIILLISFMIGGKYGFITGLILFVISSSVLFDVMKKNTEKKLIVRCMEDQFGQLEFIISKENTNSLGIDFDGERIILGKKTDFKVYTFDQIIKVETIRAICDVCILLINILKFPCKKNFYPKKLLLNP